MSGGPQTHPVIQERDGPVRVLPRTLVRRDPRRIGRTRVRIRWQVRQRRMRCESSE